MMVQMVSGSGESKDETGEKDHWTGPLKLAVFLVIKVCHSRFPEERDGQNHVLCGKNHVIDNGFDLPGGVIPGTLHYRAHIAPAARRGESRNAEDGHHH